MINFFNFFKKILVKYKKNLGGTISLNNFINELVKEAHVNAVNKGWWDED